MKCEMWNEIATVDGIGASVDSYGRESFATGRAYVRQRGLGRYRLVSVKGLNYWSYYKL